MYEFREDTAEKTEVVLQWNMYRTNTEKEIQTAKIKNWQFLMYITDI
jgi:hypothetical protein